MTGAALPALPARRATQVPAGPGGDVPRRLSPSRPASDVAFRGALRVAGCLVLALMGLIGVFLALRAGQAFSRYRWAFFTTTTWNEGGRLGIAAVLSGTVVIAAVAMVFAAPVAFGTALFVSEYAPARLQRGLVSVVDLMAAIPSVVYGLWGALFLQGHVAALARFLSDHLGWVPLFRVHGVDHRAVPYNLIRYSSSSLLAGMVVAMMVIPIASSIMREAFSHAPIGEREAAYALGSTRWGMVRSVVLPYGRGGMIGGLMLGLGRALGETIAVVLVISPEFVIKGRILELGANSVAALIASRYGEASSIGLSALMAAGLVLFVVTLGVNLVAAWVVAHSRSTVDTA